MSYRKRYRKKDSDVAGIIAFVGLVIWLALTLFRIVLFIIGAILKLFIALFEKTQKSVVRKRGNIVSRRYLAFDIETAKSVPGEDFDWKPRRPLGISCAAAFQCDAKEPIVWFGKNPDGTTANRMSRAEAADVV
jgi:hypothetical protein